MYLGGLSMHVHHSQETCKIFRYENKLISPLMPREPLQHPEGVEPQKVLKCSGAGSEEQVGPVQRTATPNRQQPLITNSPRQESLLYVGPGCMHGIPNQEQSQPLMRCPAKGLLEGAMRGAVGSRDDHLGVAKEALLCCG